MTSEMTSAVQVSELRVDAKPNPTTDREHPRLSWVASLAASDARLEGFHVIVGESEHEVLRGIGSQWDSGVREEPHNTVLYDGAPTQSRKQYWWRVRALVSGQWSEWSMPAHWTMALLSADEWVGQWIGRANPPRRLMHPITGNAVVLGAGEQATQPFSFVDPIGVISADVSPVGSGVDATITLRRQHDGSVVDHWPLDDSWGRYFSWWAAIVDPIPAGDYMLELAVASGTASWSHARTPEGRDGLGIVVAGTDQGGFQLVRELELDRPVRSARLYGVGLGYHEIVVNGRKVGGAVLDPAVSDYARRILYISNDITELLTTGTNDIQVTLGNGYFNTPSANIWGWHAAPWAHDPVALFQLEIEYVDGETVVVATDSSWMIRPSSTVRDSLYEGETYRLSAPDAGATRGAVVVDGPGGQLRYQSQPPIIATDLGAPSSVTVTESGSVLIDAGRTLTGWIRLSCRARPGSSIEIVYGELPEDALTGVVNGFIAGRPQVDVVELSSYGTLLEWEPRFTYKGFRYVRVSGVDLADVDVSIVYVHSDVERVGSFDSDVPLANWIDSATERTFLNNLIGIPTDTPVHEKNGWTGDGHLIAEAAMYAFDLNLMYRKWLDDFRDSQDASGSIPVIVPTPGWGTPVCPVFSGAYPILLWDHYRHYADRDVLEENLEGVVAYSRYLVEELGETGIWAGYSWGDWMSPGNDYAPEGPALTGTAFCYEAIRKTMWIARELGHADLEAELTTALAAISDAFTERFLDRDLMIYRTEPGEDYRQASSVYAIAFDLVPHDCRQAVADNLAHDIHVVRNDHLNTGAPSTRYLLQVLSETGYEELAVSLLTQTTEPSWGFWHAQGGDTLWEKWGLEARSRNHYFFGAVTQWIRERIGGLAIVSDGGRELRCDPVIDARVTSGSVTLQTVNGPASVSWTRNAHRVEATLTVPTGAIVHLPDGSTVSGDSEVSWLVEHVS